MPGRGAGKKRTLDLTGRKKSKKAKAAEAAAAAAAATESEATVEGDPLVLEEEAPPAKKPATR